MASSSSGAVSGKVMTDPKTGAKVTFLDMSLDDIINLKKLDLKSTEEADSRQDSLSRGRSHARSPRQQRGNSKTRNNIEGKNNGKKPHQESSGFKPGQSPLNRQPLNKQEKSNGGSKAQVEKNRDQSKWNRYPSEGSRGQWKENQYHSERSGGYLKRSHDQSERSHSNTERSHGQSERFHGQHSRFHGHSGRDHGHSKRSHGRAERSHGHSERSYGHSERSYGYSKRSPMLSEQYHDLSGRSHFLSERSHGYSERYHDQSGRHRRYSPAGRFKTSSRIESQFDRTFIMRRRENSFQKRKQERNNQMNFNRSIILENDNFSENDQGYQRYKRRITTLFLNTKHTEATSVLRQPKGVSLKYNFQAMGNQTKITLNERFSKMKMKKEPESIFNN